MIWTTRSDRGSWDFYGRSRGVPITLSMAASSTAVAPPTPCDQVPCCALLHLTLAVAPACCFPPQEESRRLQLQSQVLQQRAMEMSMRMSSSGGGSRPLAAPAPAVVPLSQVSDLQAAMAAAAAAQPPGHHHNEDSSGVGDPYLPQHQHGPYETPVSQANSVLDAEAYMQAQGDGSLVPPDGLLPRHPPGDVTPSSVTSSRAGLHWNIPSRGSIPSPGKVGGQYGAPGSRGDPRCGWAWQGIAGHGAWLNLCSATRECAGVCSHASL